MATKSKLGSNGNRLAGVRQPSGLSRRDAIRLGAGALSQIIAPRVFSSQAMSPAGDQTEELFSMPDKKIVRPEDLAVLEFHFENLSWRKNYGQRVRLVRTLPGSCRITVTLPPQHIQEETYDSAHVYTGAPTHSWISGKSYLVFQLTDADAAGFFYTLEDLLRVCANASLVVSSNAVPRNFSGDPATLSPPSEPRGVTAIEAPYRLILSPNAYGAWQHGLAPVTQYREGVPETREALWTELWQTKLAVRPPQGGAGQDLLTLRAIWSPDYLQLKTNDLGALQSATRRDLVDLTAGFDDLDAQKGHTQPDKIADRLSRVIQVEQLALSSLGATMKVVYDQTPPVTGAGPGTSLSLWRQETINARDQYVKTAEEGYLYPWGHSATYVEITDRKLAADPAGGSVAYLEKRYFLIVKEQSNAYGSLNPLAMFPQVNIMDRQIEIDKPVTIPKPPAPSQPATPGDDPFWIEVQGNPYLFDAQIVDHTGSLAHFRPGALFVPFGRMEALPEVAGNAQLSGFLADVRNAFNNSDFGLSARYSNFSGQLLAFAPPASSSNAPNSNTTLQANRITFHAEHRMKDSLIDASDRSRLFFPTVNLADVEIPPISRLRGQETVCVIKYAGAYLDNRQGFGGNNKGKVFAELTSAVPLDFSGDLSHGKPVFAARISIIALAADTLIVGGHGGASDVERKASLNAFVAGTFDPKLYFEEIRLFQNADLKPLLIPGASSDAPRITQQQTGNTSVSTMAWNNGFKISPSFGPSTDVQGGIRFSASRGSTPGQSGGANDPLTSVDVDNFLNPSGDFSLYYHNIHYESGSQNPGGVKMGIIDPQVRNGSDLNYAGNFLSFLRNRAFQGAVTFENGYLVVQLGVRVPDFNLGIFSLHGLAISLVIRLGSLLINSGFDFKIADPNSPCVVTVAMFYGKGYYLLSASLLCSVTVNMSIEFGAGVELHAWKLASLSASISAGIHFELNTVDTFRLVGYFSCHGSLHVLGVGFNVGFDAALQVIDGYRLHVYVNLHVDIDLFFFSIGVDVPVEFDFAGAPLSMPAGGQGFDFISPQARQLPLGQPAPAAPTFKDQMTKKDWRKYCEAFG